MTQRELFEVYIGKLAPVYFTAAELLGGGLPPAELWPNIAVPLRLADLAREHFGRPAYISGGGAYRDEQRNRRAGGGRLSQHLAFCALDVSIPGVSGHEVARFFRAQRGEVLEISHKVEPVHHRAAAGPVPFAPLEIWDDRRADRMRVVFAGGVGAYDSFAHVDGRGINSSWTGGR